MDGNLEHTVAVPRYSVFMTLDHAGTLSSVRKFMEKHVTHLKALGELGE